MHAPYRFLFVLGFAALAALLPACSGTRATPGAQGGQVATVVGDSPMRRQMQNPMNPDCVTGQVLVQVNGCTTRSNRFTVPAGRVNAQVIFKDTRDTVQDRRLETCPVPFAFDAECGRQYVVRGMAFHPQCAPSARPTDPSAYRVVVVAQDAASGRIVQKLEVDPSRNRWRNTSPNLLQDALGGGVDIGFGGDDAVWSD